MANTATIGANAARSSFVWTAKAIRTTNSTGFHRVNGSFLRGNTIHVTRQASPYQQHNRNHSYNVNQPLLHARLFSSATTSSTLATSSTGASTSGRLASRLVKAPNQRVHIRQQAFTTSASASISTSPTMADNNDSNSNSKSVNTTQPQFSTDKDTDPATALPFLKRLIDEYDWTLDSTGTGISKTYWFKTYTKCLDFTQTVGIRSKAKNHHSTITLKSGSVHIHWTTHYPRESISQKDIFMAEYCDEQAKIIGTVERPDANRCGPPPPSSTST